MKSNKKLTFILISLFILIFLSVIELSFVSAGDLGAGSSEITCYQETANVSTLCGGLNSGSYLVIPNYLYINYTKPTTLNLTRAIWYVKHDSISAYNISINNTCINYPDKIVLRFYSCSGYSCSIVNLGSFGQCFNGTDWINTTLVLGGGGTLGSNLDGVSSWMYDGNWNTEVDYNEAFAKWKYTNSWTSRIFEEGIYWIQDTSNLYENSQSFNDITTEYNTENFIINLTYDSSYFSIINARLNYNGTSYLGTKTGTGDNVIFNRNIDIEPTLTEGENRTFYWTIELTNLTGTYYYNSSFNNQSIYLIGLDNCTTYSIHALNFTALNQNTLNRIFGWNFKGIFNYFVGNNTSYKTYSTTMNNINKTNICINSNFTIKITGSVQYSADNYATTDYNFINFEISNQTQNLTLYLLNLSFSTSFLIKVQDNNQVPLSDYLVYIYRYDAGNPTPYLVQVTKTDSDGKSIGFFETETVDYKFIITDNQNNIIYTSEKKKIIPETTPYTLIFTIGKTLPSPFTYYDNFTGIDYSLSFDKNTYLVTLIYTDSNSSFTNATLYVKYLNSSINQSIVCNLVSENPTGVLVCDIGNYSGTYSATAYISRGSTLLTLDNIIFNIDTLSRVLSYIGLLAGFFIILIFGTAFLYNEVAGIISINIGIIFVQLIGLINFGWIFVFGVIAISIIMLIFMERG